LFPNVTIKDHCHFFLSRHYHNTIIIITLLHLLNKNVHVNSKAIEDKMINM